MKTAEVYGKSKSKIKGRPSSAKNVHISWSADDEGMKVCFR